MTDISIASGGRRRAVAAYAPRLGFGLAILALLLLAAAPVGWRLGVWHYSTSFWYLMAPAAWVGLAAAVVSLVSLLWWGEAGGAGRVMGLVGLVVGAVMFYVPWQYYHTVQTVPRIHDITTDTANPPVFVATLPARQAEKGASTAYGGPDLAKQQQAGYPDIAPLRTQLPPDEAFKRALGTAQGMSGWTIVASDPQARTIEGSQRTMFMGFTDDFVIRVSPDGSGSRIDMRSESRQGRSDFGVNAKRIRGYLAALKEKLG
jgi:uncharacterized protein (DUF1499 family)